LFITEAPIKALSLSANGFPAIGLGGVAVGYHDSEEWKKTKHLTINKELARIDWRKRKATVVYDAGVQNNAMVALGAAKLAVVLKDAGAAVCIALIPLVVANDMTIDEALTYEGRDQGPDDFLGRNGEAGPAKLRAIVDAAVPADPIERAKIAMASSTDRRPEAVADLLRDLTFVAAVLVGGQLVIDQVTTVVSKSGIKKRAITEAVTKLTSRLSDIGQEDTGDDIDLPYLVDNGRIAMQVTRAGKPSLRYLSDFDARIVNEITRDDGVSRTREYRIEVTLPDGARLPCVDVAADRFAAMDWTPELGLKAILRAGRDTRDHVRVAIQHLSQPAQKVVYSHIGWRNVNGSNVYLHPGGAIGAGDMAVEVDVGDSRVQLPDAVENIKEAIQISLSILECGQFLVTLPVLAAAYTSIYSSILEVDFGLWAVGQSGVFKSGLCGLTSSHFGDFNYHSLAASWYSTPNYLENQLFRWKDALLTIDNFVPSATSHNRDLQATALRIIQSIGDRSSRGRNDRSNQERARRDPRGLVVMTGEDLPPTNESTVGRLLIVDVPKGALDLNKILEVQSKARLLPHAMRAFIEWVARDFDSKAKASKDTRDLYVQQLREGLRLYGVHERTPANLATLGTGFSMFLTFAHEVGVLDDTTLDYWKEQTLDVLLTLGRNQKGNSDAPPTERYLSILKTLILQGRVALVPVTSALDLLSTPTCRSIGWVNSEAQEVLLVPELAWDSIENFIGRERWPYKSAQLHKQLREKGLIRSEQSDDGKERLTCRRSAGHKTVRVFVFDKALFNDVLEADSSSNEKPKVEPEIGMALDQIFGPN